MLNNTVDNYNTYNYSTDGNFWYYFMVLWLLLWLNFHEMFLLKYWSRFVTMVTTFFFDFFHSLWRSEKFWAGFVGVLINTEISDKFWGHGKKDSYNYKGLASLLISNQATLYKTSLPITRAPIWFYIHWMWEFTIKSPGDIVSNPSQTWFPQ